MVHVTEPNELDTNQLHVIEEQVLVVRAIR